MGKTFRKYLPRKDRRRPRRAFGYNKDYSFTNLDDHIFSGDDLKGVNFTGSSLRRANFKGAFLEGAIFENCDLSEANFTKAKATGANFKNCFMTNSIFDEILMDRSNFSNVEAQDISMWKCIARDANFSGAQIISSNLDKADFERTQLIRTNFYKTRLRSINAYKANLYNSFLSHADISKSNFTSTDMTMVCLERAIAHETNFINASLIGGICNGIDASNASFVNCLMKMAQFSDSCFDGTKIIGCNVYGASFWNIKGDLICSQSLDLSKEADNSIISDNLLFAPMVFLVEEGKHFIDIINVMRLKSVLILGKDTDHAFMRLKRIQEILKKYSYIGIIAKEQNEILSDSTIRKISTLAMLSNFVIIENSSASGHLFELPFIRNLECITIVLQEVGKGSTWMLEDMYKKYNFIKKVQYEEHELEYKLKKSLDWAFKKNKEYSKYHLEVNPWLKTQLT